MIRADFLVRTGVFCGFRLKGHAGSAPAGRDIVCAAVSSAFYMAANTLTEVCGCRVLIRERDGYLFCSVPEGDRKKAQTVLQGLQIHTEGLYAQYPTYIQVFTTEV